MMALLAATAGAQLQSARLDSLQKALAGSKADTAKVILLNQIGQQYSTIDPDKGIEYAQQALKLSTSMGWGKGIANADNMLGICFYQKSDNPKALQYWEQALKIFTQEGNKKGILKVIGNIGVVHTSEGAYAKSLDNYFVALKYAEELNDQHSIAINLGNIGSTYEYLKDYGKALEYNQKAVALFTSLGDRQSAAIYLGNTGNVHYDRKEYAAAIRYTDSALKLDQALGDNEGIARGMVNLGSIYAMTKDYDHAFDYYFKALTLSQKLGFRVIEASTLRQLGEALLALAKDSTATYRPRPTAGAATLQLSAGKDALIAASIRYFKESIAIDTAINNLDELQHNYGSLSEAEALAGYYKEALESHRQYMLFRDSVFSAENKIRITNLETQRELDLKDKQIIIDRLEVAKKRNERVLFAAGFVLLLIVVIIVVRNIRLSTAKELSENKLNAFQARMNPHFIFNSLSSIQSLIMNNEMESSIDYLSEFSILMRQVLDNSALSKVPLKTEIDMLRSYIELEHLRFDGFSRTITVADNIAEENLEVPGMIIQPFVENAILHGLVSKGAEGTLDVAFTRAGKHIICTVEDNGIGRERSAEINKKRSKTRQSHGTAIATNRLTLLNDKKKRLVNKVTYIDKIEDGVATGTKVIIELPIM